MKGLMSKRKLSSNLCTENAKKTAKKNTNDSNLNENQSKNSKFKANEVTFKINDQVWAKKLNQTKFWPALISEIPSLLIGEYKVDFYGTEKNSAYIKSSELIHLSDSSNPNRGRLDKNISEAFELAMNDSQGKKLSNLAESKINDINEVGGCIQNNENVIENGESNLKEKRDAAKAAKTALIKTPSQLQQQRTKIKNVKGQELDDICESTKKKYDQFKSISENFIKINTNQKKRVRNLNHVEHVETSSTCNQDNLISSAKSERNYRSPSPTGVTLTFSSQVNNKCFQFSYLHFSIF